MPADVFAVVNIALLLLLTVLGIYICVRVSRTRPASPEMDGKLLALQQAIDATERMLREELSKGREETASNAKLLREEITNSFTGLANSVRGAMDDLARSQRTQLDGFATKLNEGKAEATANAKALREEVTTSLKQLGEILGRNLDSISQTQKERLERVAQAITELAQRSGEQQETLRKTVEARLDTLRTENAEKLEQMRQTVDEKLQGTLEQRLGASFKLVSDQLEQVFRSVGEMQKLASGVGDLKRVLTNVKARGTWGEAALGNLLEQVMALDQYAHNVEIRPGSNQRVEYAIRLPGTGETDGEIWLPIDAKYPQEDYDRLVDAAERGDQEAVEAASKAVETRIRMAAKEICDKYVCPPHSTDFAVLFLPTEGLFAEIVRRPGLVEALQRECRIIVTGPTTLLALLNSLRMGFRTLAIQKRSSEVWRLLAAIKTEFGKYGQVLEKVQKKLHEASSTIESVAVRRRAIDRKLREVELLPDPEAAALLELDGSDQLLNGSI